jgi:exopolyphosphatase / guanosine-5'-triphosphate,3'-diphosphate pyrophosphatase
VTALRWEWRTFDEQFAATGERLGKPERVVGSDETYLLSGASVDAVKLRNGLMDLKRLERVDERGLELWKPVMKSPVPISAADARVVLAALRTLAPIEGEKYNLVDLVGLDSSIRAVPVHKTRRHFTVEGCMAELTDLRIEGRSTQTIAIESENAPRVITAVRVLGLDSRPNVSVPEALKTLI